MSVKVSSWVWERSRTIGNDRLVLLAIADCCNDAGLEAYPSIDTLHVKTRLSRATVFRCLDRIAAIGELTIARAGGRHSNTYTIAMDSLSLKDSHEPRRVARRGPGNAKHRPADTRRQPSQSETVQPSQTETVQPSRYRDRTRRGSATAPVAVPRPDPSYNGPLTKEDLLLLGPTYVRPDDEAAAVMHPQDPTRRGAEDFLAWWEFAYPAYNAGATSGPNFATHGDVVLELLHARPAERVQSMAIVMWTVTGKPHWRGGHVGGKLVEPDPAETWIVKSDRSLNVLRHKAQWLDRRVSEYPRWWQTCPHTPRCEELSGCQLRLVEVGPE